MMKREGIPFDGFGSVLEMLHRADNNFREKILNNLRRRDPELARRLESGLRHTAAAFAESGGRQQRHGDEHAQQHAHDQSSRVALERSQRAAFTRNYGN